MQGDKYYLAEGEAAFEDGTPDYLALPAVEFGLAVLSGDRHRHDSRARALPHRLAARKPDRADATPTANRSRASTALARPIGAAARSRSISTIATGAPSTTALSKERANAANISLRTGCFCNPGGGEIALGITGTELASCFHQPEHETHLTVDDFRLCIDGKSTGAVRVSLGLVSNLTDVDAFIAFAESFVN